MSSALQSYANIPAAFELTVQLPELKSASSCDLDVTERHVRLTTQKPVSYLLELDLPYPVDEDSGSARFDKTKHQLVSILTWYARTRTNHFLLNLALARLSS